MVKKCIESNTTQGCMHRYTDQSCDGSMIIQALSFLSGCLRSNLNPLNLARWIDSWPFDKTWKPAWIDSTWVNRFNGRAMNLEWIFIMTTSCSRKSFPNSKALPYFFFEPFVRTEYGYDGDGFNATRLFQTLSLDSAERLSLVESSAFLIENAQCSCVDFAAHLHCRVDLPTCMTSSRQGRTLVEHSAREKAWPPLFFLTINLKMAPKSLIGVAILPSTRSRKSFSWDGRTM